MQRTREKLQSSGTHADDNHLVHSNEMDDNVAGWSPVIAKCLPRTEAKQVTQRERAGWPHVREHFCQKGGGPSKTLPRKLRQKDNLPSNDRSVLTSILRDYLAKMAFKHRLAPSQRKNSGFAKHDASIFQINKTQKKKVKKSQLPGQGWIFSRINGQKRGLDLRRFGWETRQTNR